MKRRGFLRLLFGVAGAAALWPWRFLAGDPQPWRYKIRSTWKTEWIGPRDFSARIVESDPEEEVEGALL